MKTLTFREHNEILDSLLPHDVFLVYQDEDEYQRALRGLISFHKAIIISKSLTYARLVPGYIVFLDREGHTFSINVKKGE
jgi:hypothetical protein